MQDFLHRTLSTVLAIVLTFTQWGFTPAVAQTAPDVESPIIELEPVLETEAGNTQVFTALVADDKLLKDVALYHRRAGRQAFERIEMQPLGTIGYYSVELPTDPTDLRTIEYYVQARDQGGNRTVSGFAFDPYQRTIKAAPQAIEPTAITRPAVTEVEAVATSTSEPRKLKWWAVALGVLVVGALASSTGGSSGSLEQERTELTINLPLPQ
jgi:hypothetical protein